MPRGITFSEVSFWGDDVVQESTPDGQNCAFSWHRGWLLPDEDRVIMTSFYRCVRDTDVIIARHAAPCDPGLRLTECPDGLDHITVFASCDESIAGSCCTVQFGCRSFRNEGLCIHVTIIDRRLNGARLSDIVRRLGRAPELANSRGYPGALLYGILDEAMQEWPSGTVQPPDLGAIAERMDVRVRVLGDGRIASMDDGRVIVVADPAQTRSIIAASRHGHSEDESTRALEHIVPEIWARVNQLVSQPTHVEVVTQRGFGDPITVRGSDAGGGAPAKSVTFVAAAPAVQLFAQYPFDLCHVMCDEDLAMELAYRARRQSARETIRRVVTSDPCLRIIKQRLWRPSGGLVTRMMSAER